MPPRRQFATATAAEPGARRSTKRRASPLRRLLTALAVLVGMGGLGIATGMGVMVAQIPPVETLLAARPFGTTVIYDRNNQLVASLQNGENRETVPIGQIALVMQKAVVASEDSRFYEHHGIDPHGVARALFSRGSAGGGSTLTQQLAKNLFLSFDRTMSRKVADMWLAIQLERTFSKEKILEMYLNQVYFGHGAYGIEAASKAYFGKHASRLTLGEAATLTGLLPAPEYFSRRPEAARDARERVLKRMLELNLADAASVRRASAERISLSGAGDYAYRAPYFTTQVLTDLSAKLGADFVMRGGLKIYTTMDLGLQEIGEKLVRRGVSRYRAQHVGQGALVAIAPKTGEVRVLVGGTDYATSQFNRATQAHRQPGSTFKPFVYLTAFNNGYYPGTTVEDSPVSYGRYAPVNYDRRYRGTVTLANALGNSLNVPTVKIASAVTIDKVIATAHAVGIKSDLPANLSLALGSAEVTPLELTSAYATFANDGNYIEPHLIVRVEDKDGKVIEQFDSAPVAAAPIAAIAALNRCLEGVIDWGTGHAAAFGRPAAGKTGTTSDNRDTWFAGYTPDLACVIWLGNDDNSRLASSATGGGLVAPLWGKFMRQAHVGVAVHPLVRYVAGGGAASINSGTRTRREPRAPAEVATAAPSESTAPAIQETPVPGGLEGKPLDEPLPTEAPADALPTNAPERLPEEPPVDSAPSPIVIP